MSPLLRMNNTELDIGHDQNDPIFGANPKFILEIL